MLYSVVYISPVQTADIQVLSIEYHNHVDKAESPSTLITNPSSAFPDSLQETEYVFVGQYPSSLIPIIQKIESKKSFNVLSTSEYASLEAHFGYSVKDTWKSHIAISIEKKRAIKFVPFQILPEENVQTTLNIIASQIPGTTFEQLFAFVDKSTESVTDAEVEHTFLQALTSYIIKKHNKGQKIPMESIQATVIDIYTVLGYFMVTKPDKYFTSKEIPHVMSFLEVRHFIKQTNIIRKLRDVFRYIPISHKWHIYSRQVPYFSFPSPLYYLYQKNQYTSESVRDAKYEFRLDQKGYVTTLRDMMGDSTEIYVYSLGDFGKDVYANADIEYTILQKFFPQWSTKKQTKMSKDEVIALNDSLSPYNAISTSIFRGVYGQDIMRRTSEPEVKVVRFHDFQYQYIEFQWRLHMEQMQYDLTSLFNEYKTSIEYPFIALRSRPRKENIYKICKDSFRVSSGDIEPLISKRDMERWVQYTNYIYEDRKIREVRESIRGIHCKVFWNMERLETIERKGTIHAIDKATKTCTILYNNRYYTQVPVDNYFILLKSEDYSTPKIRIGDTVQFYIPHRKYIDIDMTDDAVIHVRVPVTDAVVNKMNIAEITDNILKITKKWISILDTVPKPPCTFVWQEQSTILQNMMQLKFNERWMYPVANQLLLTDFVYRMSIRLPKKYPVVYDKFVSVLKQFYSYFIVDESILAVEETVEYFNMDLEKWIRVVIQSYEIDTDTYTVVDTDIRRQQTYKNIKRNYLRPIRIQQKSTSFIHFVYRRVSDFSLLSPVQQIIVRMEQVKATEDDMIREIATYFHLSRDKAEQVFQANRSDSKIAYMRRETGTDVQLEYVTPVESESNYIYTFHLRNSHSTGELLTLKRLLVFIMNVYVAYAYPNAKLPAQVVHSIEPLRSLWKISPKEATVEVALPVGIETIGTQVQRRLDELDDDVDLESLFEEDEEEVEVMEEESKEVLTAEIESEATGQERDIHYGDEEKKETEVMAAEAQKQKKMSTKKEIVSDILGRLYQADGDLFRWESGGEQAPGKKKASANYAKTCQSIDRQPKVLTDEEKKELDKQMGTRYYPEDVTDVCDMSDPVFRRKVEEARKNMSKAVSKRRGAKDDDDEDGNVIRCAALKWGSTSEKQNWYICPRVYDLEEKMAIPLDDIEFGKPGFEPMTAEEYPSDSKNAWRTDRKTKKDILEFQPRYNDHTPLTSDNIKKASASDTLFFLNTPKLKKSYIYPGLLNPKNHPKGLYSPCCFENTSSRVMKAFTGIEPSAEARHVEYILQWGKPLEPGRYGYLPDTLMRRLGISNLCKKSVPTDCVLRVSMRYDSYSFIRMMAYICGYYNRPNVSIPEDKEIVDRFLSDMISNLTTEKFAQLNRGQLQNEFAIDRMVFPIQNYIEYLLADTKHKVEHMYDLFTDAHILPKDEGGEDLFENGVRLLVIEYAYDKNEYKYRMLIPYYRSVRNAAKDVDAHYVIALKQFDKEYYELLEYQNTVFVDQWEDVDMSRISTLYDEMESLIRRSTEPFTQTNIPMSKEWKETFQEGHRKNNIMFVDDAIEMLRINGNEDVQLVYDTQKIVGVYSPKYRCMIPVFPSEIGESELSRIDLLRLYKKSDEMLVDYNKYWKTVNSLLDSFSVKKKIDVRYIYRLPSSMDENMVVSGFMSQYAVYVPVKSTKFAELPEEVRGKIPWKTDAFAIDNEIQNTVKQTYQHNLYGVENDMTVIKGLVDSGALRVEKVCIHGETENAIGIVCEPGVYIPLRNSIGNLHKNGVDMETGAWLKAYPSMILTKETNYTWTMDDTMTIHAYLTKVEQLQEQLEKANSASLYYRPVRLNAMSTKSAIVFSGFILQNGEKIRLSRKNYVLSGNMNISNVTQLRDFYQRPFVHSLLMDRWVVFDSNRLWYEDDKRIVMNKQFQYQQELYDKILKRLNRLLKEPEQAAILGWMTTFLNDESISVERKLRIFRPVYVGIMQMCIHFSDDKKQYKPAEIRTGINYIWSIYFNTWGMRTSEREIWMQQFGWDGASFDKMSTIDKIYQLFDEYKKHFEKDFEIDKELIKKILAIYVPWSLQLRNSEELSKNIREKQIIVDVTKIHKDVVLEKIFNDIIRNKVRRDMILGEYTETYAVNEYRYDSDSEVILYEYDQWLAKVNNMYKVMSRTYYNQLRTLNEIDYDMKMTFELDEAARLKKKNLYTTTK